MDGRVFCMAFAEFDDISPAMTFITGPLHDILGDRYTRFPGRETDINTPPQFIGGTFIEAEEYDELIADPINFIAEKVVPRTSDNLATPRKAMATWVRVGRELERSAKVPAKFDEVTKN